MMPVNLSQENISRERMTGVNTRAASKVKRDEECASPIQGQRNSKAEREKDSWVQGALLQKKLTHQPILENRIHRYLSKKLHGE